MCFFGYSLRRKPIRLHSTPTHDNGSKANVHGFSHSQNSHHIRFCSSCLVRAVSASLTPDPLVHQVFSRSRQGLNSSKSGRTAFRKQEPVSVPNINSLAAYCTSVHCWSVRDFHDALFLYSVNTNVVSHQRLPEVVGPHCPLISPFGCYLSYYVKSPFYELTGIKPCTSRDPFREAHLVDHVS
jgi:hypothetical protein